MQEKIEYTEEEIKKINEIAENIDINDEIRILSFASNLQRLISTTSLLATTNIKKNRMEYVGKSLNKLVKKINETIFDKRSPFFDKLLNNKHGTFKERLVEANKRVDEIENEIKQQQFNIVKDMLMYAEMYKQNLEYYRQISIYIDAGNQLIKKINEKEKNIENNNYLDINDKHFKQKIEKFNNRIKDLEVSKIVSMQLATELKLMQNMNQDLAYKIQSMVLNVIPIWHNQIITAIGVDSIRMSIEDTNSVSGKIKQSIDTNNKFINHQIKIVNTELNKDDLKRLQNSSENIIKTAKDILHNIKQNEVKQKRIIKSIKKEN